MSTSFWVRKSLHDLALCRAELMRGAYLKIFTSFSAHHLQYLERFLHLQRSDHLYDGLSVTLFVSGESTSMPSSNEEGAFCAGS